MKNIKKKQQKKTAIMAKLQNLNSKKAPFSKCEQAEEMFAEIKLYNGVWLETAKKISTQQKKFKISNLNKHP